MLQRVGGAQSRRVYAAMLLHALRTYRALLGIQRQDVHNVPILVELLLGGIAGIAVQRLVLASRQTKISSATLSDQPKDTVKWTVKPNAQCPHCINARRRNRGARSR